MNVKECIIEKILACIGGINFNPSDIVRDVNIGKFVAYMDVLDIMGFECEWFMDDNYKITLVQVGDDVIYDINDKLQTFNP